MVNSEWFKQLKAGREWLEGLPFTIHHSLFTIHGR